MEKATREQTKTHNHRLVLKTVYQREIISRADVARVTHLTRTTVSDIVAELIDEGLLVETGMGESIGGKPPILIQVRDNARLMICLDLSAQPFTGAVIDLRGHIVQAVNAYDAPGPVFSAACDPGLRPTGEAALAAVYDLLDRLAGAANAPVIGIGLGVPGLTDPRQGIVRRSVHLNWTDLPLGRLLAERYHLPVYLINDGHAAALAEYTFGALRGSPNLIAVRISEGIGSGILLSGHLHYGDGYGAGEIGHLTVVDGGRLCSCGNYGCLETVASPPALIQRMRELAEYDWVSFMGQPPAGGGAARAADKDAAGDIHWDFVRRSFEAGDETTLELVKEAGRYLGVSIANLISILNLRHIVISGCYVAFGDIFQRAVSAEVERRALPMTAAETQIVYSQLGPEIVALGVSAVMLDAALGLP